MDKDRLYDDDAEIYKIYKTRDDTITTYHEDVEILNISRLTT